ncbi:MAG TPA: hypothetical protein VLL30_26470, partial [Reyranella sp.]|nr:hypothetical protein [Reyranella sp.]
GERAKGEGAMRPWSNHSARLEPAPGRRRINFLPFNAGGLMDLPTGSLSPADVDAPVGNVRNNRPELMERVGLL